MAFGESFGAFVGGFEHRQQGNVQMETAYAQNQNTRCEEIRFISKNVGAALIEVVALCGNQGRDGAYLRNQGFADEAVRRIRQSVHVEHAVVAVAVNDHAAGV